MKDTYTVNGKTFAIYIGNDEIRQAVERIAGEINRDYTGKTPLFLITLKGAVFFAADLLRMIEGECDVEAVSAKSYGQAMQSSGTVNIGVMDIKFEGRDIIIIEDIIENGYTLAKIIENINKSKPASVAVAVLLSKPDRRKVDVDVKYLGFEIPPEFVVGYGLDYAERGRNLPAIYKLKE